MKTIISPASHAKQLLLALAFALPLCSWAQIGIGTTSPHPSAMLHIAPGAGNNKGILLPAITSGSRVVLDSTQNISHGLIFFDTDLQKYYYFHNNPKMWFEMDHDWIRKDIAGASPVVGTHIYSGVPGNVGIGTAAAVDPAAKLTVVGNQSIGSATWTQDSVPPANSLIVQTWVGIGTRTRVSGRELDVKGQVGVTGTVTAAEFIGEGVVPTGGIIMYSGTLVGRFDATGLGIAGTVYEKWKLCNGQNGTPDLRGRFVAGLGNSDPIPAGNTEDNAYLTMGFKGGERTVTLTVSEMPVHDHGGNTTTDGSHTHSFTDSYRNITDYDVIEDAEGAGNDIPYPMTSAGDNTNSAGNHNHTISSDGGGAAHENRPPFYVLAFIMKY